MRDIEIKEMEQQIKETEQQIEELRHRMMGCKYELTSLVHKLTKLRGEKQDGTEYRTANAKLKYFSAPYSHWSVQYKSKNTFGKDKWQSVFTSESKEEVIREMPGIIHDIESLYEMMKEEI